MRPRLINDRWTLVVPDRIADWDAPSAWERMRFASMHAHLRPGEVLFDVGTEWGWIAAIYATFTGGENMVLFEPRPEFWPTIRMTWEANDLPPPRACWPGLVSDTSTAAVTTTGWPAEAAELQTAMGYVYIHDNPTGVPEIRLDDWVAQAGLAPEAITIDVEGAELRVLTGAAEVLARDRPDVWCSVHPDLMERDYHESDEDLHEYMRRANYAATYLGVDHEQHWYFTPR